MDMNKKPRGFGDAIAQLGASELTEKYRQETERAVDNIKRTAWDKWFRREWHRAAALRRQAERCGWLRDGKKQRAHTARSWWWSR